MAKLRASWIVEEQYLDDFRWWRTNSWEYDSKDKAFSLAYARAARPEVKAARVLEIHHTEPVEVQPDNTGGN